MLTHTAHAALPEPPSTVLATAQFTIVGTYTGKILQYGPSLTQLAAIQLVTSPIKTILPLENNFVVLLANGEVILYDGTLGELERLPFKGVTSVDVLMLKVPVVAITTKSTVIVYSYYDHLEMSAQHKFPEKVSHVKVIRQDLLIVASNSSFYKVEEEVVKLDLSTGFSLLTKAVSIIPTPKSVILARGGTKAIYDENGIHPLQIQGSPVGLISPFIISTTGNHIHLTDLADTKSWKQVQLNKVQFVATTDRNIIAVSSDTISSWSLKDDEDIINAIRDPQEAINLCQQMTYKGQQLKLRQLQVQLGVALYQKGSVSQAINKFIQFSACPMDVIALYPDYISSPSVVSTGEIDESRIRLLTHFLTDSRRKLAKLLNVQDGELSYREGSLTLDAFTDFKHTVEEVQTAIDTTLFKCYALINPGLMGSLIRVENHCDPQLVVKTLRQRNAISELIDFYFKRGLHTEALHMLSDSNEALVRYLQRLKGDQLDLIIQYAESAINSDEGYGISIFMDSPFSDTFDRMKVMRYLDKHPNLKRIFLEYIIYELHERATIFHTKLAEIYLDAVKPDPEDIVYKKLYKFLQSGNYDKQQIMHVFPTSEAPSLVLLKTFVLSRLGHHEQVIRIQINELKDNSMAIQYIKEHNTAGLYTFLISLFQKKNDTQAILQLLSSANATAPVGMILEMLPHLKVAELQMYLTKSIRIQHKNKQWTLLEKNLLDVERISTACSLAEDESAKLVIDGDTYCRVCGKRVGGSVLQWDVDGKVRHFGCKRLSNKLKVITMDEWTA